MGINCMGSKLKLALRYLSESKLQFALEGEKGGKNYTSLINNSDL